MLGGPLAYTEIDLSDFCLEELAGVGEAATVRVHSSGADVKDCFYNMRARAMASWFCFDYPFQAGEWGITELYDDATGRMEPVSPDTWIYPCMEVVPMGWGG